MEVDDILVSVFAWIDTGLTWKTTLLVSRRWNRLARKCKKTNPAADYSRPSVSPSRVIMYLNNAPRWRSEQWRT
jgi:hypothetical protein